MLVLTSDRSIKSVDPSDPIRSSDQSFLNQSVRYQESRSDLFLRIRSISRNGSIRISQIGSNQDPSIEIIPDVQSDQIRSSDQIVQRLKFDILYIENMSLSLDFKSMFSYFLYYSKVKAKQIDFHTIKGRW